MQHLLFSSSLAEKRKTKVPTLALEQVGAQGMASGNQSLFYELGYCALTERRGASGQRVNVVSQRRLLAVNDKSCNSRVRQGHAYTDHNTWFYQNK